MQLQLLGLSHRCEWSFLKSKDVDYQGKDRMWPIHRQTQPLNIYKYSVFQSKFFIISSIKLPPDDKSILLLFFQVQSSIFDPDKGHFQVHRSKHFCIQVKYWYPYHCFWLNYKFYHQQFFWGSILHLQILLRENDNRFKFYLLGWKGNQLMRSRILHGTFVNILMKWQL